ncbi:hypothetical protein LCGC14_2366590 [marine sediment metagenome]|uniref:Major facilitator superfamily (MFS) profile domain-containing protein n=1 Tax=marine sediment metagenome TaxID=412755 RepID=A0A0F9CSA8_9ZZZZ
MGEFDQPGFVYEATTRLYSRPFILISIANFFVICNLSSFFLFPLFINEHGGNKSDIGILMAAMMISSILMRPWISQLVDRFGRKKSYFLGTLIMTIMPVFYLLFDGPLSNFYTPLFAIRIVHGMGVALGFTSSFTYVADISPPQRLNEGLGMFGITALVGMAVGPGISEPIIHNLGFGAYFSMVSMLGAIALVLQLFLPETYVLQSFQNTQISFFSVLKRRKIFGIALLTMLFGFGLAAQGGFVSPYVEDLKLPSVSVFFAVYSMAAILTRFFVVRIADRVGEQKIIPFALAINALGYLSLTAVKNSWLLIFSGIITGCGHGLLFPCLNSLAIRDEPAHIRGKINGVFTGGMDSGLFLGSIFLGYIGEWFGYHPIFFSTFLILMTGLGIFFGLFKTNFIAHDRHS